MTAFSKPRFTVPCSSPGADQEELERRWRETFAGQGKEAERDGQGKGRTDEERDREEP